MAFNQSNTITTMTTSLMTTMDPSENGGGEGGILHHHHHQQQQQEKELPGLITMGTRLLFEEVISCGLIPLVTVVGVLGNVLSLVVLVKQGTRETTSVILLGLTVTDLLFVVLNFAVEMECLVRHVDALVANDVSVLTRHYLSIPSYVISRISAFLICLVALERYVAVHYPLKVGTWITRRRVIAAMVLIYFATFALFGPLLSIYKVGEGWSSELNATVLTISFNQFTLRNLDFLVVYTDMFLAALCSVLPVAIVTLCSCSIVRLLQRSQHARRGMTAGGSVSDTKRDADQRKITKMLLSVCVLFIVCTVPDTVLHISRLAFVDDGFADVGRYQNTMEVVSSIVYLFSLVNSSVNFALYILTSRKFAATFRSTFLRCCEPLPTGLEYGASSVADTRCTDVCGGE